MKNSHGIFLCMLVLLLTGINCYSQNDYRPGYYISNSLDTVHGLLNFNTNSSNAVKCEFKKDINSNSVLFSPGEINSYVLADNRYYVSDTIKFKGVQKLVFLEYLVNGIVDLYYYNEGLEEYFYIKKDGEMMQLENNEITFIDEYGGTRVINTNQYKGAMKYIFKDAPQLDKQIANSKFQFASLVKITKEYHRMVCTNESCIDYTKRKKKDVFCEVLTGADLSFMRLGSSRDYILDLQPLIGANIRIKDNRYNSKINFLTGFNLSQHDYSGGFRNTLIYPNRTMSHGVDMNFTLLRIPITLEYVFLPGKFKPSISFTYNNNFLLNADYKVAIWNYYNDDNYNILQTESPLRRYEYGLMLGAGFTWELNKNSYLSCVLNAEYRLPNASFNLILDRLYFQTLMFHVAYGFRII